MNDDSPHPRHQRALAKIIERSATDPSLRERLLTDPHATLEDEIGLTLDERLQFVEPAAAPNPDAPSEEGPRTIVLPERESESLSEDQLEAVSGGTFDKFEDTFQNLFHGEE